MNNDSPQYICAHRNHLFASFTGGQLGHSLVGHPNRWAVLLGSEQFGLGDEITALSSTTGGVLIIGCQNKTSGLHGSGREDWVLKDISAVGINPNTVVKHHYTYWQLTKKPVSLGIDQTEQFGDFRLRRNGCKPANLPLINSRITLFIPPPKLNQTKFDSIHLRGGTYA